MKSLCKTTRLFVMALSAISCVITSCGSDGPDDPTPDEDYGGNGTYVRHLKSLTQTRVTTYSFGTYTKTRKYNNFVYDSYNRVVSVDEEDYDYGSKAIQLTYTSDGVTCSTVSFDGDTEMFRYTLENNRITGEYFDGSNIKYEYSDGLLSLIDDSSYSSAIYQYYDDGSLRSFTRKKNKQNDYTTSFSYPNDQKPLAGPLLWFDIHQINPFCTEGTDYNWVLQLSGFFDELNPKNLPVEVVITSKYGDSHYNPTFRQDSDGYVTEISLDQGLMGNYTITFDWE